MFTLSLMQDVDVKSASVRERMSVMQAHLGKTVVLTLADASTVGGKITAVTERVLVLDELDRVPLLQVDRVRVKEGGDWKTAKGHQANSRTARIVLRCHQSEKDALELAAQRHGRSLTDYMLRTALKSAGVAVK